MFWRYVITLGNLMARRQPLDSKPVSTYNYNDEAGPNAQSAETASAAGDELYRNLATPDTSDACARAKSVRRSDAPFGVRGASAGGAGTPLDLYAVGICALCLTHCLAPPLLIAFVPVLAQATGNPLVHQSLVLLAAPATLWIVYKAFPEEGNRSFLIMAVGGLGLLLAAAFIETLSAHEELITVSGAVLLGFAHLRRWTRNHRRLAQ